MDSPTLYRIEVEDPEGPIVDKEDLSLEEVTDLVERFAQHAEHPTVRKMAKKHLDNKKIGFMGMSEDHCKFNIHAYKPSEHTGEFMVCPRRTSLSFYNPEGKEKPDEWIKRGEDKCCSYCGSIHPERLIELVKEHGPQIIQGTTKTYKLYVRRPEVPNASFGGIKYYRPHDVHAENFVERINQAMKPNGEDNVHKD